jgi:hypothetical protein
VLLEKLDFFFFWWAGMKGLFGGALSLDQMVDRSQESLQWIYTDLQKYK